jgi:hypothetical protein
VQELNEIYYGTKSTERTHRLSPALCKRAKEANDVVWLSESPRATPSDLEALRSAISEVRTAVAVPCFTPGMNVTVIFFTTRPFPLVPAAMPPSPTSAPVSPPTFPAAEFIVHMSLAAALASVNTWNAGTANPGGSTPGPSEVRSERAEPLCR